MREFNLTEIDDGDLFRLTAVAVIVGRVPASGIVYHKAVQYGLVDEAGYFFASAIRKLVAETKLRVGS